MEEYEKVKFTESGMTLIEVMVSLVILTSIIGFSGGLVKKGIDYPYITVGVENWITFIEESENLILALPAHTDLNTIEANRSPLNRLSTPIDLKHWKLSWKDCNLPGVRVASFSATTIQGKNIKWQIYKPVNE